MAEARIATTTGAVRLVQALESLGIRLVFGLPGVHNLAIWRALADSGIRLVGVRHEQTAAYAADGFARATGELGVAVVTTGPGAANTLGATGEAMASGSPVLVIATDIPAALRREGVYRGVLHETRDQAAMFAPVTKTAVTIGDPDEIAAAIPAAAAVALAAPSGPVYLGVPTDLLSQPAQSEVGARASATGAAPPQIELVADELERAAGLLGDAQRPLIWAGGGALRSGAGDLVGELAVRMSAPVITTYMGRGLLGPRHPCAVAGPVQAPPVGALWDEADVVLVVGSDLDGMMTQNWLMPRPPALVSINVDPADAAKNYVPDVVLAGDARRVLERLLPLVPERPELERLQSRLRSIAAEVVSAVRADDEQASQFLAVMERALPEDCMVVADMCIPGYWLAGYRQVPHPRKLAYPMGWGTLGFGFPASLGAALSGSGPTVCITGDGGFLYACGELATAVQERVPVTVVLVDDGGYGMLRFDQQHAGDEPFGVDLVAPDFQALANSFAVAVTRVDGFGADFEQALRGAVSRAEPEMIVVEASLKPPPNTSPRWYRRH